MVGGGGGNVSCKFTLVNVLISIFFFLQRKIKFLFCKEKQTMWEEMDSRQAVSHHRQDAAS